MRIAGVTNILMLSLNDYKPVKNFGHMYSVVFSCLEEIDEPKKEQSRPTLDADIDIIICTMLRNNVPQR